MKRCCIALLCLIVFGCGMLCFGGAGALVRAAEASSVSVLAQTRFHPEENVLVLVLDAMSTALVQDWLAADPDVQKELPGFVFFENNMETGSATQWSLASTLRGDLFSGGDSLAYLRSSLTHKDSLPERFAAAGHAVYVSSPVAMFNAVMEGGETTFPPPRPPEEDGQGYDLFAFSRLESAIRQKNSPVPTFHFHHLNGAHAPFTKAEDGLPLPEADRYSLRGLYEQSRWALGRTLALLRGMKASGLYENATIVILGDHGDRNASPGRKNTAYASRASLLLKPKGDARPFALSQAATSNMYLAHFIPALQLHNKKLSTLVRSLPKLRGLFLVGSSLLFDTLEGEDVTNLRRVGRRELVQSFPPTPLVPGITYSCSFLGKNPHIAFPLGLENADIGNGWGIRLLAADSALTFQVRADALTGLREEEQPEAGVGKGGEAPGTALDISFWIHTGASAGGARSFEPYALAVSNPESGKTERVTISKARQLVRLTSVYTDAAFALRLTFSAEIPKGFAVRVHSLRIEGPQAAHRAGGENAKAAPLTLEMP